MAEVDQAEPRRHVKPRTGQLLAVSVVQLADVKLEKDVVSR